MKARLFIETYGEMVREIPEKLEKIYELTKEWKVFDGRNLLNRDGLRKDCGLFNDLAWFKGVEEFFLTTSCDNKTIRIFWFDDYDEKRHIDVLDSFFDDFDSYIEYVKTLISENNKSELKKYDEYCEKQKREQESLKNQEYQEFLRLKEIYDNSL